MKSLQDSRVISYPAKKKAAPQPHYHPLNPRKETTWIEIYERGHVLYEQGHYKQAAAIFESLFVDRPFEKSAWEALASSRQMAKDYEKALSAWAMLALLNPSEPTPHFHAGECYLSLYDKKEAIKALKEAKRRMNANHPLWDRLQLLLVTLGI